MCGYGVIAISAHCIDGRESISGEGGELLSTARCEFEKSPGFICGAEPANSMFIDVHEGISRTAYEFLFDRCKEMLDLPALRYFGTRTTYRQLLERIDELAALFAELGVEAGDCVSICLPNVPAFVYSFYALNKLGATVVLIDPRSNSSRIRHFVNETHSKFVVCVLDIVKEKLLSQNEWDAGSILIVSPADDMKLGGKEFSKVLAARIIYSLKKYSLQSTIKKNDACSRFVFLEDCLADVKRSAPDAAPYKDGCPAAVIYTSGTTGKAKGALMSSRALNAMTKQMSYGADELPSGDTFLGCIPFFSAYGLFCGLHNSFAHGWEIILVPQFDPNEFDRLIEKYRPNNALGVPRFWESLLSSKRLSNADLSFVRIPVAGGDFISSDSVASINAFFAQRGAGAKLKVGYWATEFGGVVATTRDRYPDEAMGSVGELLPGCLAIIVDPDTDEPLLGNEDNPGELCLYTPTMMDGYLNENDETIDITIHDAGGRKYYRTGDKAFFDDAKRLRIIGRYKRDMMRPDGHTVHALPVEDSILKHDSVLACAVVGLKQETSDSGVIPTAFLVLREGDERSFEAIVREVDRICLADLPERDRALAFCAINELPFTQMGKIDFKTLEAQRLCDLDVVYVDKTFG